MDSKKLSRLRRARKSRATIRELNYVRLSVHKTNKHLYAQIIQSFESGDKVLASASTSQKGDTKLKKNLEAAAIIGRSIAEQAKEKGIERVAFDRSGNRYHGRIKQIAESAREAGLQF